MKPVYCSEIAMREVEGSVVAPQGSQRVWMRFRVVLLVVKGQRQLGVRRNLPWSSCFRCDELRVPGVESYLD